MTAQQYRATLARLGLTQVGAARLLGVADQTSRRWAAHGVTGTAAVVLHLLAAGKITVADLEFIKACFSDTRAFDRTVTHA